MWTNVVLTYVLFRGKCVYKEKLHCTTHLNNIVPDCLFWNKVWSWCITQSLYAFVTSLCFCILTNFLLFCFQVYWVGPILGGIIGGFTYEYTHDSSNQIQYLKRSFRRKPTNLKRSRSTISTNSTMSTEMTFTPTSEDLRI